MTAEVLATIADETEEQTPLPEGWRLVRLGDICEGNGQYGSSDGSVATESSGIPILRMGNINEGRIIWDNLKFIHLPEKEEDKYRLVKGDILFNRTNSAELVGKTAVFDGFRDAVFASYLIRLRVKEDVASPEYVAGFINSTYGRKFIEANMARAIGQVNINASTLKRMIIPLPPIEEQRSIATVLDEQMKAVEQARRTVEDQLKAAKLLPGAFLRSVFESEDEQNWQKRKLGEFLNLRKDVIHPRNNPKGKALFVGLEHIESATGKRIGAIEVEKEKLTGRKPQFYKDDIVYGYLRPYLNKLWIADFDGLCSVDQYVYSVNTDEADLHYLAHFMRSPVYLATAPIDSTPGQLPRIRTEEVASVELKLPPIERQRMIAVKLNEQMKESEQLTKALTAQLKAIKKMPSVLLRKAFAGEV
jgi:restriction endonuclease S subunit